MIAHTNGFFESTIILFDSYRSKFKETKPNYYPARWVQEIMKRFKQLSFVYDHIKAYENKIIGMTNAVDYNQRKQSEEFKRLLFETEFFVESFYFIAFRVREILRHKNKGSYIFPNLKRCDAKGVRDVRNHLLQHPERHGGVLNQSFSVGGNNGPKLKPGFSEGDAPDSMDKGLWLNANEFKANLEKILTEALAA